MCRHRKDFAVGDGLTVTESDALHSALPEALSARVVSAETAVIGWLETRIPGEVEAYDQICAIAHRILRRGLSHEAITPGRTTTTDLQWWYRQTGGRCRMVQLVPPLGRRTTTYDWCLRR